MFWGKKRKKKIKLKGKTQILKQKQTTFFCKSCKLVAQQLQELLFNKFASWDYEGKKRERGFPKIYKGLDGLLFFCFVLFSLLYNYIKVNFTGNILFVFLTSFTQ